MQFIVLIYAFILIGYISRRLGWVNAQMAERLNSIIIYFLLPVVILLNVPTIVYNNSLVWLSITPFIVYFAGALYLRLLNKVYILQERQIGSLTMTSGISSISFVGFPVFEMLFGAQGLAMGVIMSVLGTVLVFNTLGLVTALHYKEGKTKIGPWNMLMKILLFPTVIAFLIGILMNYLNWHFPTMIIKVMKMITYPYTALAFFTVGAQLRLNVDVKKYLKPLFTGLTYKLILAPLLIWLIMCVFLQKNDLVAHICVLGAGIGSMNSVSILAAKYDIEPELSMLMPALSIPLSIPLIFITHHLLKI